MGFHNFLLTTLLRTHPDSTDRLHRSHMTQYRYGYCKLDYLRGYLGDSAATVTGATMHTVAVEYP